MTNEKMEALIGKAKRLTAGKQETPSLHELTTRADELYRAIEDENAYGDNQDFLNDVGIFLDALIPYLESKGGKVNGLTYTTPKLATFSAYVDNLIPGDRDEDCWCDVFGHINVTVPYEWLEQRAEIQGFASVDEFYNTYTFDDTNEWLQIAIDQQVLVGVEMGKVVTNDDLLEAPAQEETEEVETFDETTVQLIAILEEIGFSDLEFDYQDGEFGEYYFFDGYSDAEERIKVKVHDGMAAVFSGYITDKHMNLVGTYPLATDVKQYVLTQDGKPVKHGDQYAIREMIEYLLEKELGFFVSLVEYTEDGEYEFYLHTDNEEDISMKNLIHLANLGIAVHDDAASEKSIKKLLRIDVKLA
jgi:hypothetical protein